MHSLKFIWFGNVSVSQSRSIFVDSQFFLPYVGNQEKRLKIDLLTISVEEWILKKWKIMNQFET